MVGFSYVATVFGSSSHSVETLSDLDIGWAANGPVLYAASRIGQNITAFDIRAGAATVQDQQNLPGNLPLLAPLHMELIEMDGALRAISMTGAAAGLPSYSVDSSGNIAASTKYLEAPGLGRQINAMTSIEMGGEHYVFAAEAGQPGMRSFRVTGATSLEAETGSGGGAGGGIQPGLPGDVSAMTTATTGASCFLFAASGSGNRVYSYQLGADGAMVEAGSIGAAEGLGLNAPDALEQITLNGKTFLLVAASGSSSISVLQVSPTGALIPTDHLVDDRTSRFQNVTSLEVVEADGRVYVIAGGADDGMSLFTLLPNGRLLHLDAVEDQLFSSLQNISAIKAAVAGGQLQVFAASATEAGLTQYSVALSGTGAVLEAGSTGGALTGTSADDILIDGLGIDKLRGGDGADIFVLGADGQQDQIRDFEAGLDRIDLSNWQMLRSLDQLQIASTGTGGIITFGAETLRLYSRDGTALSVTQIRAAIPDSFLHQSVDFLTADMELTGTGGDDVLRGRSGDDLLQGLDGADTLIGGEGNDTASYTASKAGLRVDLLKSNLNTGAAAGDSYDGIENLTGGRGRDDLYGDHSDNRLEGGRGDDDLFGRTGDDALIGGKGNDVLDGGKGGDLLRGGAGRDRAEYGDSGTGLTVDLVRSKDNTGQAAGDSFAGIEDLGGTLFNDTLLGTGKGNRILGRSGDDTLYGRGGADELIGGAGDDVLEGGKGGDHLNGGIGRDRAEYSNSPTGVTVDLKHGADNTGQAAGDSYARIEDLGGSNFADTLSGTGHQNALYGRRGDDRLNGRTGDDTLEGGRGDDTLEGGKGGDRLKGGAGRDQAEYGNSTRGITADLVRSKDNTGEASGDTFNSIEDLGGSDFDDVLLGNGDANHLYGRRGDDMLDGRAGKDVLVGGRGRDVLDGGAGNDLLSGGKGADQFVFRDGRDTVLDFRRGQDDTIALDASALWSGTLSAAEVVATYGRIEEGRVVLDFGIDELTIDNLSSLNGLAADLLLI